jgi:hypothetical protein
VLSAAAVRCCGGRAVCGGSALIAAAGSVLCCLFSSVSGRGRDGAAHCAHSALTFMRCVCGYMGRVCLRADLMRARRRAAVGVAYLLGSRAGEEADLEKNRGEEDESSQLRPRCLPARAAPPRCLASFWGCAGLGRWACVRSGERNAAWSVARTSGTPLTGGVAVVGCGEPGDAAALLSLRSFFAVACWLSRRRETRPDERISPWVWIVDCGACGTPCAPGENPESTASREKGAVAAALQLSGEHV